MLDDIELYPKEFAPDDLLPTVEIHLYLNRVAPRRRWLEKAFQNASQRAAIDIAD